MTLDFLLESRNLAVYIVQIESDMDPETTENTEKEFVMFSDPHEQIAILSFQIIKNPLRLISDTSIQFSVIEKIDRNGEIVTKYLEQNSTRKIIDLVIEHQNVDKEITLLIYRPEEGASGRILESNEFVLKAQYTPPTSPGSGETTDEGNGGSNETTENNGGTENNGSTENTENNGNTENTNVENNDNQVENAGNNEENGVNNEKEGDSVTGEEESSFDFLTLAIILGAIVFLVVVSSIIACIVNQNRKNRILKTKLKAYQRRETVDTTPNSQNSRKSKKANKISLNASKKSQQSIYTR